MTVNPAKNSYMRWLEEEELSRQAQIRTYRDYYDGDPPTTLTDRQRAFLNLDRKKEFGANVCAVIVDTVVERLAVSGFTVSEANTALSPKDEEVEDSRDEGDELAELMDQWWQQNRMDATQSWVHQAALRDAESFVVVGYDAKKKRPTFCHDYAYDGSNGVKVTTKPGTYREIAFASKRWQVGKNKARLNMYFDNRIEKWINTESSQYTDAFWEPYIDESDPTLQMAELIDDDGMAYTASVAWWTSDGTQNGEPLGVPVIPFRNRDDGTGRGLSELDNAIPLQDAVNKTVIDLMAACDWTGFQMFWYRGVPPDGGWDVYPGAALPLGSEPGAEGQQQMGALPAGNVGGLVNTLDTLIALLAGITSTPQSRFTPAGIRPAEGTQKQEEGALVAKVTGLQTIWGNAWEDVQRMGVSVAAAFGGVKVDADSLIIDTQWNDAQTRNEREHVEALAVKAERLGVPVKQLWAEAGYSAEEIRQFEEDKTAERAANIEEQIVVNQGKNADALAMIGRAAVSNKQQKTPERDNGKQPVKTAKPEEIPKA